MVFNPHQPRPNRRGTGDDEMKEIKLFQWALIGTADDGTEKHIIWATYEAFALVTGKGEYPSTWNVNMTSDIVLASGTSCTLRAAKRHAEAVLTSEYAEKARECGVTL